METKSQKQELEVLRQSLHSTTESNNELTASLNSQQSQLSAVATEKQTLEDQLISTQNELRALKKDHENMKFDRDLLVERIKGLELQEKERRTMVAAAESFHDQTMSRINTLNTGLERLIREQTETMLAGFKENASEKTEMTLKVERLGKEVIPAMEERFNETQHQLVIAHRDLEKADEDSKLVVSELQNQVAGLEQTLSAKEKSSLKTGCKGLLLRRNPEDQAALKKCKSDHGDIETIRQQLTELKIENNELKAKCQGAEHAEEMWNTNMQSVIMERDAAKEELRQLYAKQRIYDDQERHQASKVKTLEEEQQKAKARDMERQRDVELLEHQLTGLKTQMCTRIDDLEAQIRDRQRENDSANSSIGKLPPKRPSKRPLKNLPPTTKAACKAATKKALHQSGHQKNSHQSALTSM